MFRKITEAELRLRHDKIRRLMREHGVDAAVFTANVNLLYTCGRVVNGYLYLPLEAPAWLFLKRPNDLVGERISPVRKPEQITQLITDCGLPRPQKIMLEGGELSYSDYCRLSACFPGAEVLPIGTNLIRQARSVKTDYEIEVLRQSGKAHSEAYSKIPSVWRPGMTDLQLSIEVERLMRLEGCLGIFRVFGKSMEIFMGSILTGDNAAAPSPYDFAIGGAGMDPSIPVGANGSPLLPGQSIMVDMGGNFFGYICDMTRVFSVGKLTQEALDAQKVCMEVQEEVIAAAKPGAVCEELYDLALKVVERAGFADKFMGLSQKAKFVGHGIGLEINEAPVLAPRMKQELEPGMVFALEPKIVIPSVGPLGIENSWAVTTSGVEKLTLCPEEIIGL